MVNGHFHSSFTQECHRSACWTFSKQNCIMIFICVIKIKKKGSINSERHPRFNLTFFYWAEMSQRCHSPWTVDDKHSFVSGTNPSITSLLHTACIFNPLCLASALRWLIHTYVSLMKQGQRLLGWNVGLSLRGKECISAFLNVKPLWLKKHKTYYACICSLGRGRYCCE